MDSADVIVVGAGVVGLAVARELALRGREVLILEAAGRFGTGAGSRNSEVIHAGIYYPRGSLKARLCVAGRERLYEFCRERAIAHRRCGKLIVAATEGELPELTRLAAAARANGVELALLGPAEARAAGDAQACLERAARIVDAGVDHLAVARAGAGAEAPGGFEDQDLAAPQRQFPRHRKPDHARPDHDHIRAVHSPPV